MDPIEDYSRVDAYAAGRRRALQARELWKPIVAGSLASLAVSAAIWVILPKVSYREIAIEVPKVTYKNVTVPAVEVTTHSVDIPIPRAVPETSAATPRTPAERRFEDGKDWKDPSVVVRGRILREQGTGFVIAAESGEVLFSPARIGPDGRPQADPTMRDDVAAFLGSLCVCSRMPVGVYHCVALSPAGGETEIRQVPVGKPTRTPSTAVARPAIEARR
jgi:hypothetical protein